MPLTRKVSGRQMELLVEFAEANKDLALGRCLRGPLARQATRKVWEELAVTLNSVPEGTWKSADQWRRVSNLTFIILYNYITLHNLYFGKCKTNVC